MIEYKQKEANENENEVVIVKSGQAYEFTVGEARENLTQLKLRQKELAAQKELEDAKCHNIAEHNAFIADLTEEQQHAVWMYYQSFGMSKACQAKITEIAGTILGIEAEAIEIKNQTGITL